ncbi:hypothetical protein [Microbacterium sp. Se5.02b]|uniref:hypothetical protein n=1 Tax=Microbacterium sp. Se5.02b TaxID=2864103 RepID=UPI001C68B826|nr:hypothetical protein [Microbacterium sp. Se5.02b]QYM64304.1 hypothetical protein K1X59_20080 [Microbacterium sp. Se5.02b]
MRGPIPELHELATHARALGAAAERFAGAASAYASGSVPIALPPLLAMLSEPAELLDEVSDLDSAISVLERQAPVAAVDERGRQWTSALAPARSSGARSSPGSATSTTSSGWSGAGIGSTGSHDRRLRKLRAVAVTAAGIAACTGPVEHPISHRRVRTTSPRPSSESFSTCTR